MRFLSHAETLRFFQRACVRAGIELEHSKGFNPHPRLSLVLPRAVGVESDDEMLCLRLHACDALTKMNGTEESRSAVERECELGDVCNAIMSKLSAQLPEGVDLLSATVPKTTHLPHPCSVNYTLTIRPKYLEEDIKNKIEDLLTSESLYLQRPVYKGCSMANAQPYKFKGVDVRPFLKSIKLDETSCPIRIIIECKITSAGSIRVDELLSLLDLDIEKLAAPIRRANVQWSSN